MYPCSRAEKRASPVTVHPNRNYRFVREFTGRRWSSVQVHLDAAGWQRNRVSAMNAFRWKVELHVGARMALFAIVDNDWLSAVDPPSSGRSNEGIEESRSNKECGKTFELRRSRSKDHGARRGNRGGPLFQTPVADFRPKDCRCHQCTESDDEHCADDALDGGARPQQPDRPYRERE